VRAYGSTNVGYGLSLCLANKDMDSGSSVSASAYLGIEGIVVIRNDRNLNSTVCALSRVILTL